MVIPAGNHAGIRRREEPPEVSGGYAPQIFGVRPAFGFCIRHAGQALRARNG